MTSVITAEIRPNKFTTRKGHTCYGVRITVRANGVVTDVVEFKYDRSSLASFVEARQRSEWFKRGIDTGASRADLSDAQYPAGFKSGIEAAAFLIESTEFPMQDSSHRAVGFPTVGEGLAKAIRAIPVEDGEVRRVREALEKCQRIMDNRQPDKMSDGVHLGRPVPASPGPTLTPDEVRQVRGALALIIEQDTAPVSASVDEVLGAARAALAILDGNRTTETEN